MPPAPRGAANEVKAKAQKGKPSTNIVDAAKRVVAAQAELDDALAELKALL